MDVHNKHRLRSETLFLCVSVLDRVLSVLAVTRRAFQLVGMVCLWIASKSEDMIPPEVNDLMYDCDGAYSRSDVISAEAHLLNVLNFDINVPTPLPILRRALKAAGAANRFPAFGEEESISCLSRYVLEIALSLFPTTKWVRPPLVAAAPLSTAAIVLQLELPWGAHMATYTGWSIAELEGIETKLMKAVKDEVKLRHAKSSKLSALKRKFNSPRYCHISDRLPGLLSQLEESECQVPDLC